MNCRICGNSELKTIFSLGKQPYSGFFPKPENNNIEEAELTLLACEKCLCCQLSHIDDVSFLYGDHYGYRSSLNGSMLKHLSKLVDSIMLMHKNNKQVKRVLDIGCNDGSLLQCYGNSVDKVGIDPSAGKFTAEDRNFTLFTDFFPSHNLAENVAKFGKFDVITAISVFYDFPNPGKALQAMSQILNDKGIICLEQSYLIEMINKDAFDSVCHEHLLYLSLTGLKYLAKKSGLTIIDVETNEVNGGSIRVYLKKINNVINIKNEKIETLLSREQFYSNFLEQIWKNFEAKLLANQKRIKEMILKVQKDGLRVCGLGASTKGNIIINAFGLTKNDISFIGEINESKFGCETPGTKIPIVPESQIFELEDSIGMIIILPWHFKETFDSKKKYKQIRHKFVYPIGDVI